MRTIVFALIAAALLTVAHSTEQPSRDDRPKPFIASVDANLKELVADLEFSDADAVAAGEHVLKLLIGPMRKDQKFISRVSREPRDRVLVFVAYEFPPHGKFTGFDLEFRHQQTSPRASLERIAAAHYE
jgi:hypothetical protein